MENIEPSDDIRTFVMNALAGQKDVRKGKRVIFAYNPDESELIGPLTFDCTKINSKNEKIEKKGCTAYRRSIQGVF